MDEQELIRSNIHAFLKHCEAKEMLRFVTVGSVDDGKSTLIGRLLHDTNSVYADQLDAVKKSTKQEGMEIDFSLITDGLKAEREQGITIDVAYRYFATEKRKFIIADTPGHVQYTRNMATGASTAQVALILIDARLGILSQSKRHAYIAQLLGIPHLAVCINKMDLKGYDEKVFESIKADFSSFTDTLKFERVDFFPISALCGDNIVERSIKTSWFKGATVLEYLETVPIPLHVQHREFCFPVQYVLRPNLAFRGFAGSLASGVVKVGDRVKILPSGRSSSIKAIHTFDGELSEAYAPQAVTLCLNDEIDVSRSDVIIHEDNDFPVSRRLEAMMVWMSEAELDPKKPYWIKHGTALISATVEKIIHSIDVETLSPRSTKTIGLNDIYQAEIFLSRPLVMDEYQRNRQMGAFILIDRLTNATVACGMISGFGANEQADQRILTQGVTGAMRASSHHHSAALVWIEGLPGSGRMIIARALEKRLFEMGCLAYSIDRERMGHRDGVMAKKDGAAIEQQIGLALSLGHIVIVALTMDTEKNHSALQAAFGAIPSARIRVETPKTICADRLRALGADPKSANVSLSPHPAEVLIEGTHLNIDGAVDRLVRLLESKKILVT